MRTVLIYFFVFVHIVEDFAAKWRETDQVSTLTWKNKTSKVTPEAVTSQGMYPLYSAGNAVDGVGCTLHGLNHFSHTENEWNPWWQVDLGTFINISFVEVTGRRMYNEFITISVIGN